MLLSTEGLVIVLCLVWLPLVSLHVYLKRRANKTDQDVFLVYFLLVLAIYVCGSMLTIVAGQHDNEYADQVVVVGELIWLLSPMIASQGQFPSQFFPKKKTEISLCVRRALIFGIPICFLFAAGDQLLLHIGRLLGPMDMNFLANINFSSNWVVQIFLAFFSNFTIGPLVDFLAPVAESLYVPAHASAGIASYFLYAIPEEIGWAGVLYPLLLKRSGKALHAMICTGLVWGCWHVPYMLLMGSEIHECLLFIVSCVTTRCLLTMLIRPVRAENSPLLESTIVSPSLLPAIFAHAALNVWWAFYRQLFPLASGWVKAEYSLGAVMWQVGLLIPLIKGHNQLDVL